MSRLQELRELINQAREAADEIVNTTSPGDSDAEQVKALEAELLYQLGRIEPDSASDEKVLPGRNPVPDGPPSARPVTPPPPPPSGSNSEEGN